MVRLLALDQGTTSSRAVVFDERGAVLGSAQQEFRQHFPRPGWVEHDAVEIWETVRATAAQALESAGCTTPTAVGITNQRETLVVWDRHSGAPLHHAIVWQDRRTADRMEQLRAEGHEELLRNTTGLLLDPYFSAGKLEWLLENEDGLRAKAERGDAIAGTIDSWLVWNLTEGQEHVTDITNASRTLLMDLRSGDWDNGLLELFRVPRRMLPRIVSCTDPVGTVASGLPGAGAPLCGIAGDQQSALFGQLCMEPGMVKCTYGTGCFMLMQTGTEPVPSRHRLLTTVAWKLGAQPTCYALEGSVFVGGSAIQWLRDGLGIINSAPEVNELAAQVEDNGGVVLVPAFTGLGAPHWDPTARGILVGITRGTGRAHIARAALESIALQVTDLLHAMREDSGRDIATLRVDGGASASDLLMQIQSDLLDVEVDRPRQLETTALGAALMAGLGAGVWNSPAGMKSMRTADRVFHPHMTAAERASRLDRWARAVRRAREWEREDCT